MKRILAFAGSNNSQSINFQLVQYAAKLMENHDVTVLDIRGWKLPIYSQDMDADEFTPEEITQLMGMINEYDGFMISVPEHNEGPTVFFKNITDWLSRRSDKIFAQKPLLLLGTSPGRRAAAHSREYSERTLPALGANVVTSFGLPSFNYSMIDGKLIEEQQQLLEAAIETFNQSM